MIAEFTDLLQSAIWSEIIAKLNTAIPAVVDSYDKKGPYVSATIVINKTTAEGEVLTFKSIVKVPVVFPRTNRFKMSYPLEAGDGVLLLFSQRSLDEWYNSGKVSTPVITRTYALTDAIAIPGLFGLGQGKAVTSEKELEIEFDDVKITSDGKKWKITGDMELNGSDYTAVREEPLNTFLTELCNVFSSWVPVASDGGAALKTLLSTFLASHQGDLLQLKSTKNKLG